MNERERQRIFEKLDGFSSLDFGFYPTPLEEMPRLRAVLGDACPRLFIKRDDYTGFGFGGNKVRKLEYILAAALSLNSEVVITTGGERSNHARLTAAFCARLGLRCVLVLDRKPRPAGTENLKAAAVFIEELFGAEVHLVESIAARNRLASEIAENLRRAGKKVFVIPLGGAVKEGALGFVRAIRETDEQAKKSGVNFSHVFFSSSTGGTHAGMLIGASVCGWEETKFVGISPEDNAADEIKSEAARLIAETGEPLGVEVGGLTERIEISDAYAGAGYCLETPEANTAIQLLARTEAVFLDPVYTGKAMAGLIDWIEKGRLTKEDNVLFWHTGGQPTLFYVPTHFNEIK